MTDTITVPLNRLALWAGNVRKTGITDGIPELAASIAAHGLLQSLVVRKGKRGKYEIVAGQRRYLALQALLNDRTIANDFAVPCTIASDSVDAAELSLAENVVRLPMHPADQFEAFRVLIDGGATVADVAARFGASERVVTERLKLGRLSPVILAAYRNDEIGLDEAQAFAISDDHGEQERVFSDLTEWNRSARTIRRALTQDEVATSDKRVRFVGLEAYVNAGGIVRRDLFSDEEAGYLPDVALLDRLVRDKLETVAAEVKSEGWLWVETSTDADHQAIGRFSRRYPEQIALSEADQAEVERLSEIYDALVDEDDADQDALADVEAQIDALNARTEVWPDDARAIAGAVITIGYQGDIRIERGLVRKEDEATSDGSDGSVMPDTDSGKPSPASLPASLVLELTAEKTAAVAAELANRPDIALAAVVHALLLDALRIGYRGESCLRLTLSQPSMPTTANPEMSKARAGLDRLTERLGDHVPGTVGALWPWCLARSRDELLDILAVAAAKSIDVLRAKTDRHDLPRLVHGDALALALGLDMTNWFTPTAESYFSRVNRSQILADIDEAKGEHAPALEKLKKADLAARAAMLVAGTGWLPKPVRIEADESDNDA